MKRRDFLKAMLACASAPAIVKANNIMRINPKIIMPFSENDIIYGDRTITLPEYTSFRIDHKTKNIIYQGGLGEGVSIQQIYDYVRNETGRVIL